MDYFSYHLLLAAQRQGKIICKAHFNNEAIESAQKTRFNYKIAHQLRTQCCSLAFLEIGIKGKIFSYITSCHKSENLKSIKQVIL